MDLHEKALALQAWLKGNVQRRKVIRHVKLLFERVQVADGSGRTFYHNTKSHVCSWLKPRLLAGETLPITPWIASAAAAHGLHPPPGL